MKLKDIGEINLVKRLAKKAGIDRGVVKGIGDDTAVLEWTKDKYLLFTCDMLVEGVHFKLREAAPFQIGWKALGRNLSDIAAMGGLPRYALVSIGLNKQFPVSFLDEIYRGILELGSRFGVKVVGGDTTGSERLVIDISLIGQVEKKNLTARSGAKENDLILVTGSVGGSMKGRHLDFIPRVDEARRLVKHFKVSSMIDISDGLVLDLWRILDASRVGARIYKNLIPQSGEADSFEKAITDGEDFELCFTMSAKEARRFFKTALAKMKTPVTLIGEITDRRSGYKLIMEDGRERALKPKGYLHF